MIYETERLAELRAALQSSREDAERLAEALKNLRVYGCSGFAGIRAEANALADEALAAHDKANS